MSESEEYMSDDDFEKWIASEALTDEHRATFVTKSPHPVPAGYLLVRKKSTNSVIAALDIPVGFQPDRWLMSWYARPFTVKRMEIFSLDGEDYQFERVFAKPDRQ